MRNLLAHAGRQGRGVAAAFIATAFAQNDAAAAKTEWRKVADQLRSKLPKLAAMMDEAEVDVLAYMDFPAAHRTKRHSTNSLERLNGEVKRRLTSPASSPMKRRSTAWSVLSCSSRTTNGRFSAPAT
jgi:transposase-like protein